MNHYKRLNTLFGWGVFFISAFVYILTLEPSASFWDCPEFISSAYKQEIGHPPGNPIFMLTGRFFANFAGGPSQVAYLVNLMSGLLSAGTILFLFWTITHLTRRLINPNNEPLSNPKIITVIGCGLVGSLLYAFTDTFWFSAVEGEVYAYSSFCTATVFWLILKWEESAEQPHADRYIILIAYLIGISIGVHLLNLLCIPAIVLVYYYKKNPDADLKGSIKALFLSFVLIVALLYGLIPGFIKVAGWTELLAVNTLGLPFNSGVVAYFFMGMGILIWGLYESYNQASETRIKLLFILALSMTGVPFIGSTLWLGLLIIAGITIALFARKKKISFRLINTALLCLMVMMIGYSSYALILIRSSANPPMDQSAPNDIFTLAGYLNREQYGDRPLLYGYTFVSNVQRDLKTGEVQVKKGDPIWREAIKNSPEEKDKYTIGGYKEDYVYNPDLDMLFPRMNSQEAEHIEGYKGWVNFRGTPVVTNVGGETKTVMQPTFGENLKYFINYQVNYMYWRYFMWNFSGRQNDIQGHGGILNGNWLTGFNFIDSHFIGNQSTLPDSMRENRGRNVYYMMPLLLGLIGLFYQAYQGKTGIQQFWTVFFLFFMTGLAIVIYLNQTPYQPRERDYAYAGSFYAFSIWIGIGVAAIVQLVNRFLPKPVGAALAVGLCLLIPMQMLGQNWNDHDRSGRYLARDFGMNCLSCVEKDGIIFTSGDNDTFPLWYAQETEGFRTDVRVCNLGYLTKDWYINQMKMPAYTSQPLPISMSEAQYVTGNRDFAYLLNQLNQPLPLAEAMGWLLSEDSRTKQIEGINERIDYLPAQEFTLPIDSAAVVSTGFVPATWQDSIVKQMLISYKGKRAIYKSDIAILDILNNINKAGWKRPVYYAVTVPESLYSNFQKYFSLVGMAYQVIPVANGNEGIVNTEKMYDNMMNKFRWGGIDDPHVYLDENCRNISQGMRIAFKQLAEELYIQGDTAKAIRVLDYCEEKIPAFNLPYDEVSIPMANIYLALGQDQKGSQILKQIGNTSIAEAEWLSKLPRHLMTSVTNTIKQKLHTIQFIASIYGQHGKTDLRNQYIEKYKALASVFQTALTQSKTN